MHLPNELPEKPSPFAALDAAGLNLQAVFDLDRLPGDMVAPLRARLDPSCRYRQLILVGHLGRTLWTALQASGIRSQDPIDDFTVRTVRQWFSAQFPEHHGEIIYPGEVPVGLQALGKLAGWHHASPFMVGIDHKWGSWFAYRAVLLADTCLEPTPPRRGDAPCAACVDKPCIDACPGGALSDGRFALAKCTAYRRQVGSFCATTCLARLACPLGMEYRYCAEQIRHAYAASLKMIERLA